MILDLSWLRQHPKESQRYQFSEAPSALHLEYDEYQVSGDVETDLEVTNTGRLMVGKGAVSFQLTANCARCLAQVQEHYKIPFTVELCPEEYRSEFQDENFIYFTEDEVDLKPVVAETVILNAPLRFLCSEGCLGYCAGCGMNLNENPCKCEKDQIDPRWESLKKML